MRGNFTFTHQEDAERFQGNNGGIIHDNTHNNHEWNNNNYTVHIDESNEAGYPFDTFDDDDD